jgi:hypothetical protein
MFAGLFLPPCLCNHVREMESNLPLAFAGSLCYVGIFMDLALLSALFSMIGRVQKLACGCGGIGRRTTLRW